MCQWLWARCCTARGFSTQQLLPLGSLCPVNCLHSPIATEPVPYGTQQLHQGMPHANCQIRCSRQIEPLPNNNDSAYAVSMLWILLTRNEHTAAAETAADCLVCLCKLGWPGAAFDEKSR
jgi:hypothetical protein